jgi:hypothetical protein
MSIRTAGSIQVGDQIVLSLPARDVTVTVGEVRPTGRYAFGSTTNRMLRFTFTDAPRVVSGLEVPEQQNMTVPGVDTDGRQS